MASKTISPSHPVMIIVTNSGNPHCASHDACWLFANKDMLTFKPFAEKAVEQLKSCDPEMYKDINEEEGDFQVYVLEASGEICELEAHRTGITLEYA